MTAPKFSKGDKITNAHVPGEIYIVTGCGQKWVKFVTATGDNSHAHVSNMKLVNIQLEKPTKMKTPLECVENYEDPAYEAEMSFGPNVVKVNVPAVRHYRGERFTARNKAEVKSALDTGKWKLNR